MPCRLRILTLNIAHGRGLSTYQGFHSTRGIKRNLQKIARLLERYNADIVAMQEVDENSHWNRNIHLLDFLKEEVGYSYSCLRVHNRRGGRLPLAYGNGVLSRFPIEYADHRAFGTEKLGGKGFAYTEHALPDGCLPVVNLHLDYKSRLRRIEQIERLISFLEERHAQKSDKAYLSPIVCGDFNSRAGKSEDAVMHLFNYLQEDCAYQLYPKEGRTFHSVLPVHGLDFVFVPPSYKVLHCEIIRSYVSDHRPVLVDIEIA